MAIRFAAGAVACLKINLAPRGTERQSPRATPPLPNQRRSCSPPPIRAEQGGGTKGEAQDRLRRGPATALGSRERSDRAAARWEATVCKVPGAGVRMQMPGCYREVRDPVGPDRTRGLCALLGSGALPRGGDLSAFAVPRRRAKAHGCGRFRDLFVPPTASSFPSPPLESG